MPTISQFYGISIYMNFDEHVPPHVHARYAEHEAAVLIATGEIIKGDLPNRAEHLVKIWVLEHEKELMVLWETKEFKNIPPLI